MYFITSNMNIRRGKQSDKFIQHITYETEKDGTLTVGFVPDAELTDPGDLCGYPAE